MRKRPNFWSLTNTPGRVNLLHGIGFALWAYGPGVSSDTSIAGLLGIGVPTRYQGVSELVPSWMVMSNAAGTVVAFAGTTNTGQWLSYLSQFGASPCAIVGGQTFTPFETWATEIAGRLAMQIPVDGPLAFCGHSLGGAIAHLVAAKLAIQGFAKPVVYTCGCPRVGSEAFVNAYRPSGQNVVRSSDLVPYLPPSLLSSRRFAGIAGLPLPEMFRPGYDWHLPSRAALSSNPWSWVTATSPLLWASNFPSTITESHVSGEYLRDAWSLLDHEDRSAASAWGVIAASAFGLNVQPV